MNSNVGNTDKIIRIVLAVVLLAAGFLLIVEPVVKIILLVAGGIALLTSLVGFCPLYKVLGINTCKLK
jgi:hypothetical protein